MDDTQDKARRNLVVFCSVVLFCGFLGLDELEIIKRVFGTADIVTSVSKFRIVLVASVILIYLFLRYRFTDSVVDFIDGLSNEWSTSVRDQVRKFLGLHLQKIANKDVDSSVFDMNVRQHVLSQSQYCANNPDELYELKVSSGTIGFQGDYQGASTFEYQIINGQGQNIASSSGGSSFKFKVESLNKLLVQAKTIMVLIFYSKTSVEHVVPFALAIAAALLLFGRMVALLCV